MIQMSSQHHFQFNGNPSLYSDRPENIQILMLTLQFHCRKFQLASLLVSTAMTTSTGHSPSGEANGSSASQEIPKFHRIKRFITVFTTKHHSPLS